MERYEQIGRRIRQAREDASMTQEELGQKLGVSGVAVGHYERAARSIGIAELEQVAGVLQRPITWFLHTPRPWSELVDAAYERVKNDPTFPHGGRHNTALDGAFKEYVVRLYEKARNENLLPTEEERLNYD